MYLTHPGNRACELYLKFWDITKVSLHFCLKSIQLLSKYAFFKGWLLLSLPLSCYYKKFKLNPSIIFKTLNY